jgi:hypothetical protein
LAQPVVNELEHRRGLVLGLTLAEVLLLLLFLLILVLGARLTEAVHEAETERALLQVFVNDPAKVAELEQVLRAAERLDPNDPPALLQRALGVLVKLGVTAQPEDVKSLSEMQADAAVRQALSPVLDALGADPRQVDNLTSLVAAARRINPDDPVAFLQRAVDVMERLGSQTQPEQVQALKATQDKLDKAEKDNEQLRRERDNLMRNGNGLTYPSCWIGTNGQTEYIFDISIHDNGLVVTNAAPETRSEDPAWRLIDAFDRQKLISGQVFSAATERLYDWSVVNNCRFYSRLSDDTGPASKRQYKFLRSLVEWHFYPLILK